MTTVSKKSLSDEISRQLKSNALIAIEWMWARRGNNLFWNPRVLTAENKTDPSAPKLTPVEAVSVFGLLLEKGLIYPCIQDGHQVFCLHEAKVQEWNTFIKAIYESENSLNYLSDLNKNQAVESGFIPSIPSALTRLSEVAFSWIFWILGGDFQGAGHKLWGYFFDWAAITVFLFLAVDMVFSVWKNRKMLISILCFSSIFVGLVYIYLYVGESKKKSEPSLTDIYKAVEQVSRSTERTISENQKEIIREFLKDVPKSKVEVSFTSLAPDAKLFAKQIAAVLSDSGFNVIYNEHSMNLGGPPNPGLTYISPSNNPAPLGAVAITQAFEKAGMNNPSSLIINTNKVTFEIWVGDKPN